MIPTLDGTLEALSPSEGYAALGTDFVERRNPTPLTEPHLVACNPDAASLIGIGPEQFSRLEFLQLAAGNARFGSVEPYAAVYAGHQFGQWAGRLGDGRALTLGEVRYNGGPFEWQLKGAGITAFSRFGDGRAVLRSTIREYLCSEAMAALGIPTTRALAIAGGSEPVFREAPETAAVLSRIAPTHVRFGTFEHFHYRGDFANVRVLADYVIEHFFPQFANVDEAEDRYAAFLLEVVRRTATLIAAWQSVGFAHGVMNTDNMSIIGLTIDYGPYGFLDAYDAGFICNHTDQAGRYAFDRQPTIGLWNLKALAAALSSLVPFQRAESILTQYATAFRTEYFRRLREKFGLFSEHEDDASLIADALALLQIGAVDHTRFFRNLAALPSREDAGDPIEALLTPRAAWYAWRSRYRARLLTQDVTDVARKARMNSVNPKFVLRNYLAQEAIQAAQRGDYTEISRLHAVLRRPFDEQPESERYADAPPPWASEISVSCSS